MVEYREEEVISKRGFIDINVENIKETIKLNEINKLKNIKISDEKITEKNKILDVIEINNRKYFLYASKQNKVFLTNNVNYFCKVSQNIKCKITKKYIYFWGKFSNITHKIKGFENVFLNDKKVAHIKRLSKIKKIKDFMIMRIKISKILDSGVIHNTVKVGESLDISVPIKVKKKSANMNYYARKKIGNKLFLIRSTLNGDNLMITCVDFEKEYKKINMIKNNIARMVAKIIKPKKIILMFEKETNKANESGYYMFEKIMQNRKSKNIKSKVYFVINKQSQDYKKVKEKYKKNIIEKYSYKHYLYIYISKYFISSELSNHILNPRLYIKTINECIAKKPLIFLQHGIMFAKPVDNPAAKGFYKSNKQIRIFKNVISSDLEAEQFRRMGYRNIDLIKTGLTKFDISYMDEDADKIMFMPTYRYWEEADACSEDKIKNTTYYNAYIKVIKAFEKEGLLDKLIISCHPKFVDFLSKAVPEYKDLVQNDINKGLESAKIFITDYSSASYDAHHRGAYIIYNWEEKDYLIENYKAIPPINEDNCDGVPVYNTDELVKEVKKAIKNNYKMDSIYEERYRKINEFSDGKNGDRLLDELIKLEIL